MSDTLIILIILLIFILLVFFLYKSSKKNKEEKKDKKNKEIKAKDFSILLTEDENKYFIAFKNKKILFLVENGEIVGYIEKEKSNQIQYF